MGQGQMMMMPQNPPKQLLVGVLLALFLGVFGVHNFYLGHTGRGVAQLLITVLTLGLGSIITGIWALIELIMMATEACTMRTVALWCDVTQQDLSFGGRDIIRRGFSRMEAAPMQATMPAAAPKQKIVAFLLGFFLAFRRPQLLPRQEGMGLTTFVTVLTLGSVPWSSAHGPSFSRS